MSDDKFEEVKTQGVEPKGEEGQKPDDSVKPIQVKESYDQRALVENLSSKFQKWDTWRHQYEPIWQEIYDLYIGAIRERKTATRSKIVIPVVFQIIESAMPKLMNLVFNTEEFFDVEPRDVKDAPVGELIKKLLMYQLGRANFFLKFLQFAKQLFMYGTSYFKVYWKVERKWVWTRTPIRKPVSFFGFQLGEQIVDWKEEKKFVVTERRPEVEFLDIYDVYPDPMAVLSAQEGEGIFIRSFERKEDVKEKGRGKFPIYANVEDTALDDTSDTSSSTRTLRYSARGVSDPLGDVDGKVEIIEFWGKMDLDQDGIREEVHIVIGNRNVLLRAVSNPFHHQKRPIVKATLMPIPGMWYGMGLVEPIVSLVSEMHTLRRQRLDNVNLILNRMWKVNSLADVDIDTLISSPNGIVLTDDMAAVEPIVTPSVTESAYADASLVQADIENTTVPRSVQGIPESGRLGRTARGAQLIIGQALEKFGLAAKLTEQMAIKSILKMFHQLNLQFIDDDQILQSPDLYGHLFDTEVTPEMIRADVDFKMLGITEMIDKESKINQINNFTGIFANILTPDTLTRLARKEWQLMGFDPDEINAQIPQNIPTADQLGGGGIDKQTQQSITAQVAQNGSVTPNVPPSIPPNPSGGF